MKKPTTRLWKLTSPKTETHRRTIELKPVLVPDEYCPECMSLKRKPNKECKNHDSYWRDIDDCPKCNAPKPIRNLEKEEINSSIDSLSESMVKNIANKHIVVQDTHEGRIAQRYWYKEAQKMLKKLVKEYERVCKECYNL